MVTKVTTPSRDRAIIDREGKMSQEFTSWTQIVTNQLLIIGTGSPEGAIEAPQGALYVNNAGTAGSILYVKRDSQDGAGEKRNGWILV